MKKHTPVIIDWIDSAGVNVMWEDREEYLRGGSKIRSVGFYLGNSGKCVEICQCISKFQYGRVLRIPEGCILKMKKL